MPVSSSPSSHISNKAKLDSLEPAHPRIPSMKKPFEIDIPKYGHCTVEVNQTFNNNYTIRIIQLCCEGANRLDFTFYLSPSLDIEELRIFDIFPPSDRYPGLLPSTTILSMSEEQKLLDFVFDNLPTID